MRKIIVSEFISLDGLIRDPADGWTSQFDEGPEGRKFHHSLLSASDALLLGGVTYQDFAAVWPTVEDDFGERMNNIAKYVVSTTLKKAEWNNTKIISKNVAEEVSALKKQSGQNILIYGSGQLVNSLIQHDLIDEYWLMLFPVVLGSGKRLFRDGSQTTLKLAETRQLNSGVLLLNYQNDTPKT